MKVGDRHYRSIALAADGWSVEIIDQRHLPHVFAIERLESLEQAVEAIAGMHVRGAPLIGATAAYGMALAIARDPTRESMLHAHEALANARPTAVNLRWALDDMLSVVEAYPEPQRATAAYRRAGEICDDDVVMNAAIGVHGLALLRDAWAAKGEQEPLNVLTHCNAGWLATVDCGTALAPVYKAYDMELPIHVWVDETRPRNQGSALTAWELGQHGIPHTVIPDNAGGHLMQRGLVDLCIVGTDRTSRDGDVCNKIGTYLKALAARDTGVPFYVAAPSPSIDWTIGNAFADIPIEQRNGREVSHVCGRMADGHIGEVQVTPDGSAVRNDAFDVTPSRLVTGLITERGVCAASRAGLSRLFPERAPN